MVKLIDHCFIVKSHNMFAGIINALIIEVMATIVIGLIYIMIKQISG